jgi:hypothetical protein
MGYEYDTLELLTSFRIIGRSVFYKDGSCDSSGSDSVVLTTFDKCSSSRKVSLLTKGLGAEILR